MTAVDLSTPVGQPLNLASVADGHGFAKPAKAAEAAQTGFSFGDFIDVINPLQHIPGIAELYRSVTNDQISDQARKTGNALYGFALGGPVGLGAMLAYNALGDRLEGGAAPEADPTQVAEAPTAPGKVELHSEVPVPQRKPGPDAVQETQPAGQAALLGESVAKTGQVPEPVPGLAALFDSGSTTSSSTRNDGRVEDTASPTAASSVAYVEKTDPEATTAPVVPTDAGLGQLATHQSNRLPLDVLKALQERHAERSASERT